MRIKLVSIFEILLKILTVSNFFNYIIDYFAGIYSNSQKNFENLRNLKINEESKLLQTSIIKNYKLSVLNIFVKIRTTCLYCF